MSKTGQKPILYLLLSFAFVIVMISSSETLEVLADEVIDTIPVWDVPAGVAYNPDNGYMYVTNAEEGTVSVIDSNTNTVKDTIPVGNSLFGIAYNPSNGNMYVTHFNTDTVSVIAISPTANAGPDQTAKSGELIELNGEGSSSNGGSPIESYQWTQIEGPIVELEDPSSPNPTFTSPDVKEQVNIVFQLVVINEDGVKSEPDSVKISVNPTDSPPSPPPFEGILGSGNNFNFQIQENSGNNVDGQSSENGQMHSNSSILQEQFTEQDSQVIS